jgi:hypothetical protein
LAPKFDGLDINSRESNFFRESDGNEINGGVSSLSNNHLGKGTSKMQSMKMEQKQANGTSFNNQAKRKPHESEITGWGADDGLDEIQQ